MIYSQKVVILQSQITFNPTNVDFDVKAMDRNNETPSAAVGFIITAEDLFIFFNLPLASYSCFAVTFISILIFSRLQIAHFSLIASSISSYHSSGSVLCLSLVILLHPLIPPSPLSHFCFPACPITSLGLFTSTCPLFILCLSLHPWVV